VPCTQAPNNTFEEQALVEALNICERLAAAKQMITVKGVSRLHGKTPPPKFTGK